LEGKYYRGIGFSVVEVVYPEAQRLQ
jgi:hypothetical protein